nr:MAG TPA: hypothetical protein [Caudoviricetes sp.]
MKIFGDAETKKKFDKGAAFIVYNMICGALFFAAGWLLSFVLWLVFKLFGVA